ncbi:MAG: ABC-2 type transport system permease protein, partial [Maribacter sp.]
PSFSGHLFKNRIIWMLVGSGILGLAYFMFSFSTKSKKVKKNKVAISTVSSAPLATPSLDMSSIANSNWASFKSFFKINFVSIVKSNLFIILLIFSVILLISEFWGGYEYFGLQSYPVTYKMMDGVNGAAGMFVMITLVFFSGELVWRDRDSHISEVIDGTPHQSLMSLLAKSFSLLSIATILHLFLIGIAIVYQALQGYTNFEFSVYFLEFFTGRFMMYIVWGFFLVFLQVLINNKYLGYFISILCLFALDILLLMLKIQTKMVMLSETPSTMYSDMNGFGPGLEGHLWFSGYWILFGLILVVLSGLFWSRGKSVSLKERFSSSRKSLGKSYYGTLGLLSVSWMAVAAFIFYNTQVLNTYDSQKTSEANQVKYEKEYKKYENIANPSITDVIYNIDIFPAERSMKAKMDITITNKTDRPIKELHFTMPDMKAQQLEIPNSKITLDNKDEYRIYELDSILMPGDTMEFVCNYQYESKGFENSVTNMSILKNGTFFNNFTIQPTFGYSKGFEIADKNKRRKLDLPERIRMPELQKTCSELCMKNYLTDGTADWVNVETYISTSEDQTAIAPGSLVSHKTEDGRNKYHYKVDHPSQNFYAFISAKYEVATRKWNGIDLEVYYHKGHEVNIQMMLDAVQKSLEYYTTNFGPYYHKQARIIEFPRYSTFAQAFPGTMPYSEAFGFIINMEENEGEEKKNNVIEAVIAHEMAHQYWAHQVIGADMQGSTMLSESFAEYSSLMVMKQESTPLEMKDFLKYDLRRYLRGRSNESEKELPLHKVENQGHIHYGKGSVILYALQDYIGEDSVNAALQGFLEEYRYQEPPYPTSNDFMRYLEPRVPDSLKYLIKDWFEDITLYDLRLDETKCVKNAAGKYEVTLDIIAKKIKANPEGNVDEVPISDWVDIGFYKDSDEKELLFRERVLLDKENVKLEYTLDELPAKAAVDPLRILIDRVYDDNVKSVSVE